MDRIVHGVAKSQTRLSDFHFHFLSLSWLHTQRSGLWDQRAILGGVVP